VIVQTIPLFMLSPWFGSKFNVSILPNKGWKCVMFKFLFIVASHTLLTLISFLFKIFNMNESVQVFFQVEDLNLLNRMTWSLLMLAHLGKNFKKVQITNLGNSLEFLLCRTIVFSLMIILHMREWTLNFELLGTLSINVS